MTYWRPASLGLVVFVCLCAPASAYVGPGAGLSAIGSLLALLGAIGLAIVGFIWYPVKRLIRALRSKRQEKSGE